MPKTKSKTWRTKDQLLQARAQARDLAQATVIAEFQAVVEELRDRGLTDIDVHSLVNMIWQGWLRAGQPTQEYLDLAASALQARQEAEQGIEIIDTRHVSGLNS